MKKDFAWESDSSVVIKPRLGVAIYKNPGGEIVIRQQSVDQSQTNQFEDSFVIIPRETAGDLIHAIMVELEPEVSK